MINALRQQVDRIACSIPHRFAYLVLSAAYAASFVGLDKTVLSTVAVIAYFVLALKANH